MYASIDFVAMELPRKVNVLSGVDWISAWTMSTRNDVENDNDWAMRVNEVAGRKRNREEDEKNVLTDFIFIS